MHTDTQISTAVSDIARACDDVDALQAAGQPYERAWDDAYARVRAMESQTPPAQLRRVLDRQ